MLDLRAFFSLSFTSPPGGSFSFFFYFFALPILLSATVLGTRVYSILLSRDDIAFPWLSFIPTVHSPALNKTAGREEEEEEVKDDEEEEGENWKGIARGPRKQTESFLTTGR